VTSQSGERTVADGATVAAFLGLVLLAGGNAPAIRWSSCAGCELDPFWSGGLRFGLACVLLVGLARVVGAGMPRGRALQGAVLFGALQFGGGFGLIYWALVRTPAGLAQVLLACVPLLAFVLALVHRQERFRWGGLTGALVALVGVAVVFRSGFDGGVPLGSMAAIVGGAVLWAEALVVVKRFPAVHPAALNAVAMGVGAAMLLGTSAVVGESPALPSTARTWAALAYLVVAGSVGVFWLYVLVVRRWTASAASYQMVLIPLVTVGLAAWLQDERLRWDFAVGTLAVLSGVYLGVLRPASRERRAARSSRVT
jgi:drug/metabolite transporter (DMT)-like permease